MTRIFRRLFALALISGSSLVYGPPAQADEIYTFVVKKQEEKAKRRWYLTDWFETKEKIRLMDMWLALHTPSPYEFFVGTEYRLSDDQKSMYPGDMRVRFAAYASIFGLEIAKTLADGGEFLGLFNVRIFGFHVQSTNITLQGGLRATNSASRSATAGVASTIYLAKPFGIDGFWRNYFKSTPNSSGTSTSGSRYEIGAFLDFSFVRVQGGYFHESFDFLSSGISTSSTHSGSFMGTKIFF